MHQILHMCFFMTFFNFDAFLKQNGSFIFPQNRGAHDVLHLHLIDITLKPILLCIASTLYKHYLLLGGSKFFPSSSII